MMTRRDSGAFVDAGFDAARSDTGPADAGSDANLEHVDLCEECVANVQCGPSARCARLSDDTSACLQVCVPDLPSCPRGFECVMHLEGEDRLDTAVCVPIGRMCCIDADADGYGRGAQCLGTDCDDDDIDRHPGADETCDLEDDDCDTNVDEASVDCVGQRCDRTTSGTYEEAPPSTCSSGDCTDVGRVSCALYACNEGEDRGDFCATTCAEAGTGIDSDAYCADLAHCDLGSCLADVDNGGVCDEDSDCESAHCDNGFCCNDGVCCGVGSDCPGAGTVMPICEDTHTCQGTRGVIACVLNQCQAPTGTPDDSGCGPTLEADTCGPYRSVYCTGGSDQRVACPTSCTSDAQCDDDAHCDGVCIPDATDGNICDEDSDCVSSHCNNNVCCASGDCCRMPLDCPASYGTPPVCDTPGLCQGHRNAPTCLSSVCGTVVGVDDDSACTTSTLASDCGLFPSRFCAGGADQMAPMCAAMCTSDSDCDANAHCDLNNCVADVADGTACDENSDCIGGHCQNGFCCASGDCCATAANCASSTYATPPVCNTPSTCQGTRRDPACSPTFQCQIGGSVDDDSGCVAITSNTCGLYPSISCTSSPSQPSDQMSLCPMSCATSANCDAGAFCMSGVCMPRGHTGDACTDTAQCDAGLTCADGVCCTTACTGTCRSCALPGSLGTCTNVPLNQDPDSECGSFTCAGYYWGWGGSLNDQCYRRADPTAAQVSCNGAAACQVAADICPAMPQGPLTTNCNDTCQTENTSTCSGVTAGVCNNLPAGSQTCGTGACMRTTAVCNAGSPVTCTPGTPVTESCNDIDDNCDGTIDNGAFTDIYETNNTCGTVVTAASLNTTSATLMTITPTLYANGDADYFRVAWTESDGSCTCGTFSTDEDFRVTFTLTVPSDAGSYQLCANAGNCSGFSTCTTIAAGASGSVNVTFDGVCSPVGGNDSGSAYVRVTGVGTPAFECSPYTLRAQMSLFCS